MAAPPFPHYRTNSGVEPPVSPIQTEFSSQFPGRRVPPPEGEDVSSSPVSPIMSRRESYDSDRRSTVSGLTSAFPSNPTNVDPAPLYVAAFGASQVVSEHHAARSLPVSESEDEEGKNNKDDVQFSESALALVNAFLDQLLYSILSHARSTSLAALRPAVTEVLKHRLARDAISSADSELAELLAGGDEEEDIDTKHKAAEEKRTWHLELVWKRTRLRVMVYMRLGEMEDEDEQRYVQQEERFHGSERRFSSSTGLVSWSAAIFLTSVLEYVAEQALQIAGQAAYVRIRRQSRSHRRSMSSEVLRGDLVVEEHDVEKVALNSLLGRLWRSWRKSLRSNGVAATLGRPTTPAMIRRGTESTVGGRQSFDTPREGGSVADDSRPMSRDQPDEMPEVLDPEQMLATSIPLPLAHETRDIDEIAVPGLARDPDAEDGQETGEEGKEKGEKEEDGPYPELLLGTLVALPMVDEKRDVDEIEVPGLARDPDDVSGEKPIPKAPLRRGSFAEFSYGDKSAFPTLDEPGRESEEEDTEPPTFSRQRSMSHPMPVRPPVTPEEEPETKEEVPEDEALKVEDEQESNVANASAPVKEGSETEEPNTARDAPTGEKSAASQKSEYPWMAAAAGAAVAVASAAGAAVSAWSSSSATGDSADKIADASEKNVGENAEGLGERETHIMQPTRPEKDVEELDKRKSLLNVKHMMFVNGKSEDSSAPSSPPAIERQESNDSFTLGKREGGEGVLVGDGAMEKDGIDANATGLKNGVSELDGQQQARERSPRPRDLVLNASSATSEPEDKALSTPRTPRQFLDLTSESDSAPEQPPLPTTTTPTLVTNVTDGAAVERPPSNKSPSEREFKRRGSAPSIQKKPSAESAAMVQEHPVVQRMASRKGSEPSSASGSEKHLPLTSAAIKGPQDFDLFVQGSETLKYTLTPEHVRDQPFDNQTRFATKTRETPVELDATPASREAPPPPPSDGRTGRSITTEGHTPSLEKRRSQSRPSARNTSRHRKSGLMAREPQVMTESTRDIADFIRSTAPDKDPAVAPILQNPSRTSLHSLRSAHIYGASASRSTSRASSPGAASERSRIAPSDRDVPPVPPIPRSKKSGMQPRGATIVDNGSADLIDFIRSGPKEDGQHRISRSVAPFRTTMDSDRVSGVDTVRGVSTGAPSARTASLKSAKDSRSALLNGVSNGAGTSTAPAVQKGIVSKPSAGLGTATGNDETSRKRHRGKDPYAIDFDDLFDDDDEGEDGGNVVNGNGNSGGRPQTLNRDESFLEFLRNHEPVSSGPVRPLIDPNSAQARRIINNARNGVYASNSPRPLRTSTSTNGAGPSSLRTVAAAGPSSQQQQSFPPYSPSNGVAQLNSSVSSSPSAKTRLQAKSSGSKRGGAGTSVDNTNDLAYFIRNSGPPDDPNTAPAPEVGRGARTAASIKSEGKKRGSFFGKSKKTRYLDMP